MILVLRLFYSSLIKELTFIKPSRNYNGLKNITSRGKTQDSLLNEYLIKSHIETIPGLGTGLLLLLSVGNEIDQTSAIY